MNITKRGDNYRIRVYTGKDENGRPRFVVQTFHPEIYGKNGRRRTDSAIQKEVEQFAREFEKNVKAGKYSTAGKMTFQQFALRWRDEWAASHLTESIQKTNWSAIERLAVPAFGNKELAKIGPLDVQALINDMHKQGLKSSTIKRQVNAISSVFRFAESMEIIDRNPVSKCEFPRETDKDDTLHYFTVDQARRFLHSLEEPYTVEHGAHDRVAQSGTGYHVDSYCSEYYAPIQYQAFFTLAIFSGARRGELVALKWSDIDFDECRMNISRTATRGKDGCTTKEPKTAAGNRSLTLPKEALVKLREWKREQMLLCMRLGSEWQGTTGKEYDENFIFIQLDSGKMMDLSTPTAFFKKALKRYNDGCANDADKLPEIRLHDLRHTAATLLIDANVPVTEVSRRLGHSETSVTLNIYAHAMPQNDQAAADILGRIFSESDAINQ